MLQNHHFSSKMSITFSMQTLYFSPLSICKWSKKHVQKSFIFSFQIHVFFPLQNHRFLSSRCIDGLQKLDKSCKKTSFLIEKIFFFREKSTCSQLSVNRWSPKNLQKAFIFHSKHILFNDKSTFSSFSVYRWHSKIVHFQKYEKISLFFNPKSMF